MEVGVSARTHNDVLGVDANANGEQIRIAYRHLARVVRPDRHRGDVLGQGDLLDAAMAELNAAWSVLSDPNRRRAYDESLGIRLVAPRPTKRGQSSQVRSAAARTVTRVTHRPRHRGARNHLRRRHRLDGTSRCDPSSGRTRFAPTQPAHDDIVVHDVDDDLATTAAHFHRTHRDIHGITDCSWCR